MRQTIPTVFAFMFVVGLVCAGLDGTAHAGEFRILLVDQLTSERGLARPKGRVLINGGWADGLVEGLTGNVVTCGDGARAAAATVVTTKVEEHESVCEFTAATEGGAVIDSRCAAVEVPAFSVMELFAMAEAVSSKDCARAMHYYDQVLQLKPDYHAAAEAAADCRRSLESEKRRPKPMSVSQRDVERARIPDYLEIAVKYRDYRQYDRECDYVDRVLKVDSSNQQALALRQALPPETGDHSQPPSPSSSREPIVSAVPVDVPEGRHVDTAAEMIQFSPPAYPRLAYAAGMEGCVWIKALVGQDGTIVQADILKSSGNAALDQPALEETPYCRFKPAILNGQPVATRVAWKVVFLQGHSVGTVGPCLQLQPSVLDSVNRVEVGMDDIKLTVAETGVKIVSYTPPEYPRLTPEKVMPRTVSIKVLIAADGSVVDAVVLRSSGVVSLDQAALDAVPKCVFKPAVRDGKLVATWFKYDVVFQLGQRTERLGWPADMSDSLIPACY